MAMTLVSTVTVGSGGAASISFTGIPQTGKDLLLLFSGRTTGSGNFFSTIVQLNSTYGDLDAVRELRGNGSSASSTNTTTAFGTNGTLTTANTFTSTAFYVANYTSSTTKSVSLDNVGENNATLGELSIMALRYLVNAGITSMTIGDAGTFAQHSTASLYIIS